MFENSSNCSQLHLIFGSSNVRNYISFLTHLMFAITSHFGLILGSQLHLILGSASGALLHLYLWWGRLLFWGFFFLGGLFLGSLFGGFFFGGSTQFGTTGGLFLLSLPDGNPSGTHFYSILLFSTQFNHYLPFF